MEGQNQVVVHGFFTATSKYIEDGDLKTYETVYRSWYSIAWAMPIVMRALESRGMDARRARYLCTYAVLTKKIQYFLLKSLQVLISGTPFVLLILSSLLKIPWEYLIAPLVLSVYALLQAGSKK